MKKTILLFLSIFFSVILFAQQNGYFNTLRVNRTATFKDLITIQDQIRPETNEPVIVWDTTATKSNLDSRIYGVYEGALVYVTDIDSFYVYNGSEWMNFDNFITGGGESIWSEIAGTASYSGNAEINGIPYRTKGTTIPSILIGPNAGDSLQDNGWANYFIGTQAGEKVTTGDYNVAIGWRALQTDRWAGEGGSANYNVAIGALALQNATKVGYSIAIGYEALNDITTGHDNHAIGYYALHNLAGNYWRNIANGYRAGESLLYGEDNVLIGAGALDGADSAYNNSCFGNSSLYNINHGYNNVAMGFKSGYGVGDSLKNSVLIGANTLGNASDYLYDIIAIGDSAGFSANVPNTLWLGKGDSTEAYIYGNKNYGKLYLNSNVDVKNNLIVTQTSTLTGAASLDATINTLKMRMSHKDDADTYFQFLDNRFQAATGGHSFIDAYDALNLLDFGSDWDYDFSNSHLRISNDSGKEGWIKIGNVTVPDSSLHSLYGGRFEGGLYVGKTIQLGTDDAYGVGWNGSLEVPTKNAIYDKIETVTGGSGLAWPDTVASGGVGLATAYDLSQISTSSIWSSDANGITYSSGNVGINTASSATYDLSVGGKTIVGDPTEGTEGGSAVNSLVITANWNPSIYFDNGDDPTVYSIMTWDNSNHEFDTKVTDGDDVAHFHIDAHGSFIISNESAIAPVTLSFTNLAGTGIFSWDGDKLTFNKPMILSSLSSGTKANTIYIDPSTKELFEGASGLSYSDTIASSGVGLATAYDLTQIDQYQTIDVSTTSNDTIVQLSLSNDGEATKEINIAPSTRKIQYLDNLTDKDYEGTLFTFTAGEDLENGQIVRMGYDEKMYLATNQEDSTSNVMALYVGNSLSADSESPYFLLSGVFRNTSWSFTVNEPIYLDSIPGAVIQTMRNDTAWVNAVGLPINSTTIKFNPSAYKFYDAEGKD